jgi:hypothetical protein
MAGAQVYYQATGSDSASLTYQDNKPGFGTIARGSPSQSYSTPNSSSSESYTDPNGYGGTASSTASNSVSGPYGSSGALSISLSGSAQASAGNSGTDQTDVMTAASSAAATLSDHLQIVSSTLPIGTPVAIPTTLNNQQSLTYSASGPNGYQTGFAYCSPSASVYTSDGASLSLNALYSSTSGTLNTSVGAIMDVSISVNDSANANGQAKYPGYYSGYGTFQTTTSAQFTLNGNVQLVEAMPAPPVIPVFLAGMGLISLPIRGHRRRYRRS